PRTEECPINGEMLGKSQKALWEKRRPLGIMIENHEESRPQSGLSSADVVYEAVAEGGITRFMGVFYCKDAVKLVGPVRSARVYYIDLLSEYGDYPLYTHVGGANCNKTTGSGCDNGAPADALGKLEDLGWFGYNDLNFIPFPVMWRDYERLPNVATEHTVYSTTKKLWDYSATKRKLTNVDEDGAEWDKNFVSWKFKDDEPVSTPTASTISFGFWDSMPVYAVKWTYDKETNSYKRSTGGVPHLDKNTNKQLQAKNVIVAFAKEAEVSDGYDMGQHMLYDVVGTNDAIVFMDGKAIKGTWKKKTETARMRFYDTAGKEIALNRGQDFVEIVPEGNDIDYK
ncbi:MAG: DUF3048 domain-containing protein, partial [Patescibacteria group bacterium]